MADSNHLPPFVDPDTITKMIEGAGQAFGDALTMLPFAVALITLASTLSARGGKLDPPRGLGQNES